MKLEDRWYTSTEVAQVLGVSLRSVYRYLEEGKLEADIKTATGRHRFTKKNVLDFLYPGAQSEESESPNLTKDYSAGVNPSFSRAPLRRDNDINPNSLKNQKTPYVTQPTYGTTQDYVLSSAVNQRIQHAHFPQNQSETSTDNAYMTNNDPVMQHTAPKAEPIDWLSKFRDAASRVRATPEPTEQPYTGYKNQDLSPESIKGLSNFEYDEQPSFAPRPAPRSEPKKRYNEVVYYRSSIGGLKDIAQGIDRSARKSFLDYAFTLQAGLSLHKPIRPFSVLHAYIWPRDRAFFERMLGLIQSDEHNAQLALIFTEDETIFNTKRELHGLFVVADAQLKHDIQILGDNYLTNEVSSI